MVISRARGILLLSQNMNELDRIICAFGNTGDWKRRRTTCAMFRLPTQHFLSVFSSHITSYDILYNGSKGVY